jgi:hypothetical protein
MLGDEFVKKKKKHSLVGLTLKPKKMRLLYLNIGISMYKMVKNRTDLAPAVKETSLLISRIEIRFN